MYFKVPSATGIQNIEFNKLNVLWPFLVLNIDVGKIASLHRWWL